MPSKIIRLGLHLIVAMALMQLSKAKAETEDKHQLGRKVEENMAVLSIENFRDTGKNRRGIRQRKKTRSKNNGRQRKKTARTKYHKTKGRKNKEGKPKNNSQKKTKGKRNRTGRNGTKGGRNKESKPKKKPRKKNRIKKSRTGRNRNKVTKRMKKNTKRSKNIKKKPDQFQKNKENIGKAIARQACDETKLCQKIKDYIKYSNQLRKVKRIVKACDTMEKKANKSATVFDATVTALEQVINSNTRKPLYIRWRRIKRSQDEIVAIRDNLKNCSVSVKSKCEKKTVPACLETSLHTECEAALQAWLTAFGPSKGSCLQASNDCCDCITKLGEIDSKCLDFDSKSTNAVTSKKKCTGGTETGSFGFCRKQQQEAAVKGPPAACNGFIPTKSTTAAGPSNVPTTDPVKNGTTTAAANEISNHHALKILRSSAQTIWEGLKKLANSSGTKQETNSFSSHEDKLLNLLKDSTTYLKNECSNTSGICEANKLINFTVEKKSTFYKIQDSAKARLVSSGFLQSYGEAQKKLDEVVARAEAFSFAKNGGEGCTIEVGVWFCNQNYIGVLQNADIQECAAACATNKDCEGWTVERTVLEGGDINYGCWLTSSTSCQGGEIGKHNGWTSGKKHCGELPCPALNINTMDQKNKILLQDIETPEICSNKCRESATCKFWTWEEKDAGNVALNCVLMSGFEYTANDNHVISGARSCNPRALPCPAVYTNTQDRNEFNVEGRHLWKNVESAEECSKHCQNDPTCNFWTWDHKDAGQWALNCVLMTDYDRNYFDTNVISGSRTCQDFGELPCPALYTDTQGPRDPQTLQNIATAEECFNKCQESLSCKFWTWGNENAPLPLNCLLMSGYESTTFDTNVISGSKTCKPELPCPALYTNTQDQRDTVLLKNIASSAQCSIKCRESTSCKFWTWAHEDAGEWSLNCNLMSAYGHTNFDTNVITGARSCATHLAPVTRLPCPAPKTNTVNRYNTLSLPNIESDVVCSHKCREERESGFNCNFWSWYNKDAGNSAFNCDLMTHYEYTTNHTKVTSGARTCNLP